MTSIKSELLLHLSQVSNKFYVAIMGYNARDCEISLRIDTLPVDLKWGYLFDYCYSVQDGLCIAIFQRSKA